MYCLFNFNTGVFWLKKNIFAVHLWASSAGERFPFSISWPSLSWRRLLGERRRPSPPTSTQVCPPFLFPSCCAKRSTPDPNWSYLYSDLTPIFPFQKKKKRTPIFFIFLQKFISMSYTGSAPLRRYWTCDASFEKSNIILVPLGFMDQHIAKSSHIYKKYG